MFIKTLQQLSFNALLLRTVVNLCAKIESFIFLTSCTLIICFDETSGISVMQATTTFSLGHGYNCPRHLLAVLLAKG